MNVPGLENYDHELALEDLKAWAAEGIPVEEAMRQHARLGVYLRALGLDAPTGMRYTAGAGREEDTLSRE
jgi:hypothetical protein